MLHLVYSDSKTSQKNKLAKTDLSLSSDKDLRQPTHYYLQNCGDDMARNLLEYLYKGLDPKFKLKKKTNKWETFGVLRKHDWKEINRI